MEKFPKRKHPRLKEYDYSQNGCYFVTICTTEKKHRLGEIRRVAPTLSQVIGAYKSKTSFDYLQICKKNHVQMGTIWQRSYYDHIIRNEVDYLRIWQYIDTTPSKWTEDEYYIAPSLT